MHLHRGKLSKCHLKGKHEGNWQITVTFGVKNIGQVKNIGFSRQEI